MAAAATSVAPGRSDLRLAGPAAAAWLSAALALRSTPRAALLAAGLLLGAGVLTILTRRRAAAAAVAAALVCAGAAAAVSGLWLAALQSGPVPALAERRTPVTAELVVTGDPERHAGRVRGSALGRDVVVVPVRAVRLLSPVQSRVRTPLTVLTSGAGWLGLLPSQRVMVTGRLAPARRGDLVAAVLLPRGPPRVLTGPSPVQGAAGRIRAGLRTASAGLPADTAGLLPGLVIGDTSRLSPELRQDFRTTGMTHLVAVSGANVAIVLGAVLVLARWLRLGPRAGPVAAGIALAGFVVLARPSPSVLRAAAMGLVVVTALATGRPRTALPALCAAVLGLVLVEPALSRSVGFALSVSATAGLLLLAPPLRERLARRLPGWLADAVAVPVAAQVACAPLIAAISAQVSLAAVPANLLAAPAVVPATLLGVLTALVAPWSPPLGRVAAELAGLPTGCIVVIAHAGARLPWAALSWPGGSGGAGLLAVASLLVAVALRSHAGRRLLAVAVCGGLLGVVGIREVAPGWPPPGWQLVACDVGQGDALVLAAGPRTAVLVDVGPDPRLVTRCLRSLGVRRVPLVLLTHLHADHVEGLLPVVTSYGVREVEVGPLDEPAGERDRVAGWVRRAGVSFVRAVDGEERSVGDIRWRVIAPPGPFHGTGSDPNNSSLVLRVQLTGFTALLTGDVEPPAQQSLLEHPADLRADVLKVPHHGSDHQEPAFLDAAAASLALTSVGAGNSYGHPSSRTLARLATLGARSYRTDRDGAVAVLARPGGVLAVARRGAGTPPTGQQARAATVNSPATWSLTDAPAVRTPRPEPLSRSHRPRREPKPMMQAPVTMARRAARAPAARAPPGMGDWYTCQCLWPT